MPSYDPPPAPAASPMVERIRRILVEPKLEWPRIAAEPMTTRGIMTGWVMPLAAIRPVAGLIGALVFGYGAFGIVYRPSIASAVTTAIVDYALSLLAIWVVGRIINLLAPTFGGVRDEVAAMKVAAFSATAGWLAGIFLAVPTLAFLSIVGLYSLYLLYLGLPALMRAAADKAVPYLAATILAAALVFVVVTGITSAITTRLFAPVVALGGETGAAAGTLSVAGVGSVDLGKLDAAAKRADAAAKGNAPPVAPAALAALLPTSIGGWTRREIESSGGAAGGIGASSASGKYVQGDDTMTLTVADIGAMGALASLGKAFNVQTDKQIDHGYEKTGTVDGRMTTTEWDAASHTGKYATVVADRFTITAEGQARDDTQFKTVAAAVDPDKLAALAPH